MDFGKVITAMVTPFDAKLKVDYGALENLIEHLCLQYRYFIGKGHYR